jgi:hypothetical protein
VNVTDSTRATGNSKVGRGQADLSGLISSWPAQITSGLPTLRELLGESASHSSQFPDLPTVEELSWVSRIEMLSAVAFIRNPLRVQGP